ncbi:hypothetical protein PVAP13_9KG376600 [Panicum virgatum]|uniref:HMA domain-containing protein n=1 Tax=Panicum virgatum TaxID=38727 RepID=A0A8T0NNK9_PANVG|nr:hypothetical protein PVAP13_9KG376600 [Panicum virgatum]KAG2551541.1 hypothetical protein PVAP13_9KG376600 [Panicum virgatum]
MEPAVGTRAPLLLPAAGRPVLLARPRGWFASISAPSSSSGGGGGCGGRFSAGGGGGGRGGGDDSGAGAAAAAAAVAALGEADSSDADADAIVLHVGGMSCGGCAAKVKRILENQVHCATCGAWNSNFESFRVSRIARVFRQSRTMMSCALWII